MDLEQINSVYVLGDGEIYSFKLNLDYHSFKGVNPSQAVIELKVRRKLSKKKFESCIVEIILYNVVEIALYEDFKSGLSYSDIVLERLDNGLIYFSLDPYGNSNEPNENDNFVIIANSITIKENRKIGI